MEPGPLKTLIVDDEPIARRILREYFDFMPGIELIGEAENGEDALRQISSLKPDLVFLDLRMPVMSGFEVVRNLGSHPPAIVIVTAYDRHAIEAYEAGAIDYLLKPVDEARLHKAVERARNLLGRPDEAAHRIAGIAAVAENPASPIRRKIIGRSGADYFLLDTDEVLAFQAERELVWIVTSRQRYMAAQSLSAIEQGLRNPQFQRVHRNAIVNVNHVRKMSALSSQRWLITLSNALELVVSKRQAHNIRQMLKW